VPSTGKGGKQLDGGDAEPEYRPLRLKDFGEWNGYKRCGEIAEVLQRKHGITVEIGIPDLAVKVARDMARTVDYYCGGHGRGTRVTRIVMTDPTQTARILSEAGIAAAEVAVDVETAPFWIVDGRRPGEQWMIFNPLVAQAGWLREQVASLPINAMCSAEFRNRPMLTLTLYALIWAGTREERMGTFAGRVLRKWRRRTYGLSDRSGYLSWLNSTVPDGISDGDSWNPNSAVLMAAAAVACGTASEGQRVLYGLLVEEAHAAAVRAALLRDPPPAVDRRDGVDPGVHQDLAAMRAAVTS
jgi:hypothetical protein